MESALTGVGVLMIWLVVQVGLLPRLGVPT